MIVLELVLQRGHVVTVLYFIVVECTLLYCTVMYCVLHLQGGHVVAVLGAVLGEGRHLPPAQLLEGGHVGVPAG